MIPAIPAMIEVVLLLYGVAVLFLFPTREVTQPPGRLQRVWEVLLPGTAPAWNMLGGLALIAWCYLLLQDFLILRIGTPYFITAIAMPNFQRAYGVPGPGNDQDLFKLFLRPSWVWVYLAPAVLFAVNLFLVLRGRRRA
ncbi:MAG: hypothetical protein ABSF45_04290 [Terriglobia bacterium]